MNDARKYVITAIIVIAVIIVLNAIFRKNPKNTTGLASRYEARAAALGIDISAVIADTEVIYIELGIDMAWSESWLPVKIPAPWENEAAVVDTVKKYPTPTEFNLLADVYDRRFSRSLRNDLQKYLSAKDLAQIPQV